MKAAILLSCVGLLALLCAPPAEADDHKYYGALQYCYPGKLPCCPGYKCVKDDWCGKYICKPEKYGYCKIKDAPCDYGKHQCCHPYKCKKFEIKKRYNKGKQYGHKQEKKYYDYKYIYKCA